MRREYMKQYYKKSYQKIGQRIDEYLKEHPCHTCGESDPDCLVFHHINPKDKSFNIRVNRKWSQIQKEIDKCVVLCANCHAKVHVMMREFNV